MKLDLIFTIRDIYINSKLEPLKKISNSSSKSNKFKDTNNNIKVNDKMINISKSRENHYRIDTIVKEKKEIQK